jgi:bifunctional UDP-N-acetylglucosamine pyrophosphorylase/glucosamine-1-phosphate N-acetyltransferase
MESGVTLVDPQTAFINYGASIGVDTVIYPFTVIENNVKIGQRCQIGPFIHLREGTRLENDCLIGNFIETVRTRVGDKTWVKHFAYLGDSLIGKQVNVGAGTVTANFDGVRKNRTVIKDKAFIGSDTVIVAPAKIGRGAYTGAGSVVLKNRNVADGAIVAGVPAVELKSSSKKS